MTYALVIHGGGGPKPEIDYSEQRLHLSELIHSGQQMLISGESAIEVVARMVSEMEASGLYVAGKGAAPNADGVIELDASIMEGKYHRAGAVAAMRNIVHPIQTARQVLEEGSHVMLAGEGARKFALANGATSVEDPDAYYIEHIAHGSGDTTSNHGTVGAVALDADGNLAAATSTGGTFNKLPGRVGDTPLIGAGTWADESIAVSCTGVGEAFIRACAAHDVSARIRYGKVNIDEATNAVLKEVAKFNGDGGIIAVNHKGQISMPFNSHGMKRAAVSDSMAAVVRVFEKEDSLSAK